MPTAPRLAAAWFSCWIAAVCVSPVQADGPLDNIPTAVRPIPKLGIEIDAATRGDLEARLSNLGDAIARLRALNDPRIAELLPDVMVYHRAVRTNLDHQEFFSEADVRAAFVSLSEGMHRAHLLGKSDALEAPWASATGLVVRGYVSRIDDTVQPYGLVVPESYSHTGPPTRLDVWFHGRGETLSETAFIQQRRTQPGQFTPADTIVLHPYGRYSNAFKFAGEVDVLEAIEDVRRRYRIDDDRIAVRGFSMGGAACWHFAVHYADRWFAANPGAGFSETPEFLRVFQNETLDATWYERKLFHWYDCTDWAVNLYQCPTVAYSGALDVQKQAADIMQRSLAEAGIDLVHIIGPDTKHAYHPAARDEVERRLDSLAKTGREALPRKVHFTTYALKYNRMAWVTVDALEEHWRRATVDATIEADNTIRVSTDNVSQLTLDMPPGAAPFDLRRQVRVVVDGQSITAPKPMSDRSWTFALLRDGTKWQAGRPPTASFRKRHDLQGPIDDAFMNRFVFVRPTGQARSARVGAWAAAELDRAIEHWRRQFRGDARVVNDHELTDEEIASSNLVLWGDPASNAVLARIASQLPIDWTAGDVVVGDQRFDGENHALIAIYPNPLNPDRYVVLNSGFTYREYAYLNNARQVPKLPDWAVVDVRTPPDTLWPGKIAAAGFFDEAWELKPSDD